jgi:integral membrane protein
MAWVTGVTLIVLTIGVILKYAADKPALVDKVGMLHGFLYIVYVVTVLTIAYQARWRPVRTVLVLLAGTVPFASFVAERKVVAIARRERQDDPVDA